MHKKFADDVSVIGVAWAGSTEDYSAFISRHGISFPTIEDTAGEVFAAAGVSGQPAFAFIANGKVDTSLGALSDDEMDTRVQELLTAT